MTADQLKKLQELSRSFSEGNANHKEIEQLSMLLAQINCYTSEGLSEDEPHKLIVDSRLG